MSKIKNIVFDFGGVLIDWNPRYLYRSYFAGDEERMEWFLQNVCTYPWNIQMDGGKPFAEGVAELTALHPEWAEAIGIYHTRWAEMIGGEVDGTASLIKRLKAAGYRVFGLTNWSMETYPLIRDNYDVFSLFEGVVVSGEEHLLKPDEKIYRCLLERYSLEAAESVFLDDNADNVAGAEAVGMEALRFVDAQQAEAELKSRFGIEL
ncbi:MAG: HAD family phosphatase [Alistipes sp.]|nr:HAD family phosphatase [Alistipes sp.]